MQNFAGIGGDDRHAACDGQIEAEMDLLIDLLAFVEIRAVIGERRFDLGVAELDERPRPKT